MRIEGQTTPEAALEELGRRIARRRLDLGLTQAQAAAEGGIGKRTVERIEAGADTQLSTLLRLLRVLELMEGVERMVPEIAPSPMELLKLKGRERKRASARRSAAPRSDWRWGDER
jgi:transcriptional regulator with XRE-family HTH domain